jgi:ubiquinone/menaquinone biosynthesis C-methylase UbiE
MITVDFKRIYIKPFLRILDIGCGSGRHTCEAYRYNGIFVVGADLNINNVTDTVKRLGYHEKLGEHGNGKWAGSVADTLYMPFKDQSFDLVICSEVMEHIRDHKQAATEINRVLKPGSDLIISVPRYFPELICWAFSDDYHNVNQGHVRIYKKKEIISLFEKTGLELKSIHFAHSLHTPYWWLKCLAGPSGENSMLIKLYHKFLVWDIMKHPGITRKIEKLLNPVLGKSIVLYFRKKM